MPLLALHTLSMLSPVPVYATGGMNLFIHGGHDSVYSPQPSAALNLFIRGSGIYGATGTLTLYTHGPTGGSGNIPLYVSGPKLFETDDTDNLDLYLLGSASVGTDEIPLYTYGLDSKTGSIKLFIGSNPFGIPSYVGVGSGTMNLFIKLNSAGEYIPLVTHGHESTSSGLNLFLLSFLASTGSIPLVLPVVMDSASSSITTLYSHGF